MTFFLAIVIGSQRTNHRSIYLKRLTLKAYVELWHCDAGARYRSVTAIDYIYAIHEQMLKRTPRNDADPWDNRGF